MNNGNSSLSSTGDALSQVSLATSGSPHEQLIRELAKALKKENTAGAEPSIQKHVESVLRIAQEQNFDPVKLNIAPRELPDSQIFWEQPQERSNEKRDLNGFTWNPLLEFLSCKPLKGEDWMAVFKSLAKAVEGRERENGMELVEKAMLRPDMTIQAIEAFPKLFSLACANNDPNQIALLQVARGKTKLVLHDLENERGTEGLAVTLGADIVRALQSVKVEDPELLTLKFASIADHYIRGTTTERFWEAGDTTKNTVFDIFTATHGLDAMMQAKGKAGYPVLSWAALSEEKHTYDSLVGHLLDLGFDPSVPDESGKTPLIGALLSRKKSAAVLQEFASRGAISAHDIAELSKVSDDIKDPESRSYITSRQASLVIEQMTAKKPLLGQP